MRSATGFCSTTEEFAQANRELYNATKVEVRFRRGHGEVRIFVEPVKHPWYTVAYHRLRSAIGMPVEEPMTMEQIRTHFGIHAPRYAGVDLSVDWQQDDSERTSVTLFGDNTNTLVRLANELERRMRLIPGVTEVNSDVEEGDQGASALGRPSAGPQLRSQRAK